MNKKLMEILDKLIRRGIKPSEQAHYSECIEKDVAQVHDQIMDMIIE